MNRANYRTFNPEVETTMANSKSEYMAEKAGLLCKKNEYKESADAKLIMETPNNEIYRIASVLLKDNKKFNRKAENIANDYIMLSHYGNNDIDKIALILAVCELIEEKEAESAEMP